MSLGFCFLLAGTGLIRASAQASSEESEYQAVDDYVTARMRSDRIPGLALAIVKGDQIVYLKAYGQAARHGFATGYRWWFGFPVPANLPVNRANLPAGLVMSSAEDMAHFLVAQMNGGRYQDRTVLSPGGIDVLQAEPPAGRYGMGWETARLNGRRLINQDGSNGDFQASLYFDPGSGALVYSLARIPGWRKRLARRGIAGKSDLMRLGGKTAVLHFTGPLAFLLITRELPGWIIFDMFQPDLVAWLYTAAGCLAVEGLVKIGLIGGVFRGLRR